MNESAPINPSAVDMADATPMIRQYLSIKQAHAGYLLFYRMGDFYELFFDDALTASRALDITLTKRGQHQGQDIPMCGVPFHSSESYLQKLIKAGYKVAVCEQMEDPAIAKKRGAKAVVKREVIRIITPGTITEESLLEARHANYLAALVKAGGQMALAWADISTGEFFVMPLKNVPQLVIELSRLQPKELLLSEQWLDDKSFREVTKEWKTILTPHVNSFFETNRAKRTLQEFFEVQTVEAFAVFTLAEVSACGALLEYIEVTQKTNLPRLVTPKRFENTHYMTIDPATRRNLELITTLRGEYKGSLLSIIDATVTSAGARLLRHHLSAPLLDIKIINQRLDAVEFFILNQQLAKTFRETLSLVPDIERAVSRICIGRAGPRDLVGVRTGLQTALRLLAQFEGAGTLPPLLQGYKQQLDVNETLLTQLEEALNDEVPLLARDGKFIREGYNPKLDDYRNAGDKGEQLKLALRDKYRAQTGVDKLKIGDNNLIGMYIEVSVQHISKMPEDFVHRQTLANAVRFSSKELKELEYSMVNAQHAALSLELELFAELAAKVQEDADRILLTAQAMASIDVATSLAAIAQHHNYKRPHLTQDLSFYIKGGRHPVVERFSENNFIKNNSHLDDQERVWLLTGPNMAGKSTFLRQNALVAILAQMGSFIPADEATIGIVDKVFSRVGASDDLARGQSTFMTEMVETATILHQATNRSLVILDEIGRGTATFDGLSIAWAVTEYLHEVNQCRSLFATHYHELTTLASKLDRLRPYTMKVKEWEGDVIFLHEVAPGTADRSYGIHVGKLAGLPATVVKRAEEVLKTLEKDEAHNAITALAEDLPLFSHKAVVAGKPEGFGEQGSAEPLLRDVNLDEMTPRQALDLLYQLKESIGSKE